MARHFSDEEVYFVCPCGVRVEGGVHDTVAASSVLEAGEMREKYAVLIRNAPFDPTTTRVKRTCPECGLDYMSRLVITDDMVVIYSCKCGK